MIQLKQFFHQLPQVLLERICVVVAEMFIGIERLLADSSVCRYWHAALLASLLSFTVNTIISVDAAPVADYLPPEVTPTSPSGPPPGSGATPRPVTSGDTGASPEVPSGSSFTPPFKDSKFYRKPETIRTYDNYYLNQDGRGKRLIMRTPAEGGPTNYQTERDLEIYDDIHAPYPGTVKGKAFQKMMPDGKTIISIPTKAIADPEEPNPRSPWYGRNKPNKDWQTAEDFEAPLPIVYVFGRKIVILGVVFATVFMAFAAYSVVLGHKDAGQRVVGAFAGLMLLLMGYSIYKVVQINAWRFFEGGIFDWTKRSFDYNRKPLIRADTPETPAEPGGVRRSNMPVRPLGEKQLR